MGDCGCAPGGQRHSRRHHHRRSRGHHQRPPVPYDRPMASRPTAPPSRIPPWNCGPGLARQREAKQYNAGSTAAAGGPAQGARLDETYNVGARGGAGGHLDRTYTVAGGGRSAGAHDRTYTATAGGGPGGRLDRTYTVRSGRSFDRTCNATAGSDPGGRLDRTYTVAGGGGPGRCLDRTYNATAGSGPGGRLDRTYTVAGGGGPGRSFDRTYNATAGSGSGGRLDRTYTVGSGRSFDRTCNATAGSGPGGRLDRTYTRGAGGSGRSFDRTYNATAGSGPGRRLDRTYTAASGPCVGDSGATCLDSTYTAHPSIRTPPNYLDYPPFDTAVPRMYPDRHMDSWEMMGLTPPGPDTPRGNKIHPPRYARRLDFSDTSDTPPRPFSPSQGPSNLNVTRTCPTSSRSPHSGDQDSSMGWFRPYMDSSHISTGQTTARKEIFDSIRVGPSPGLSAVSSSSPEDVSYDWSSETDPIFGAQRSRTRSPSPGPRQEVRGRRLNFSSDSSGCEASQGGVCEGGYSGDVEESFPSVSSQPGPSNAMFGAGGRQEENWSPMPVFEEASYHDYSRAASSAASGRQRTPAAGGRLNRTYPPAAGVRAGARSDNSFTTASAICLGAGATCLDDSYSAGAGGGSGGRLDRTYDATAGRRLDSTYTAHPSIRTPPNYLDYPRFDTAVARMYPDRHMDSWEMMGLTPAAPDTPRGNITYPPAYARRLDFSNDSSACEAYQGGACESGYAGDVEESFPSLPRPGPSNAMAGARGRQGPAAGAGQKAAGGRRKWGSPTPAFEAASIYDYSPSAGSRSGPSSAASGGQKSDACVEDGASCLDSTYTDASEGGGSGGLFVMTYPPVTGYRAGPRADGTFTTASAMCLGGGGAACLDDSYPAQHSARTPPDDMEVQGGYGSRHMDSYEMMGLTPPGPETPRGNITHPPAYARRLDFSGDSSECEASHGEACGGGYAEDADESYSAFQPGAASSTFAARGRQMTAGAAAGGGQRPGAAAGGRQRWGSPTPAYEARSIYDYSSTEGSWSGGSSSGGGQSSCRPCRHTY